MCIVALGDRTSAGCNSKLEGKTIHRQDAPAAFHEHNLQTQSCLPTFLAPGRKRMAPFFLPPALSPAAAAAATAFTAAFSSTATATTAAGPELLGALGSLSGGTFTAGIWAAGRPRRGVGSLGGEKGALQGEPRAQG